MLEIGPGILPFSRATDFVDWQLPKGLETAGVHVVDCRHTLEDLYNPMWVCREMERVGRAGYVHHRYVAVGTRFHHGR